MVATQELTSEESISSGRRFSRKQNTPTGAKRGWRRFVRVWSVTGAVLVASVGLILLGKPILALGPPLAVLIGWGLLTLPLDVILPIVVFLATGLNAPLLSAHEGKWSFFLDPVGKLLYKNLPIKFAPLDIVLGILLLRTIATIQISNVAVGGIDRRPPRAFAQAVMLSAGAILAWTVYGIGTGGSVQNMLWQVRPLLALPIVALISSVAMARERCIRGTKIAILAAGLLKVIDGSSYYFLKVRPENLRSDYVSTHADTTLWAIGLVILLADWFENRSKAARNRLIVIGLPLAFGMIINNRRTVWVIVATCGLFIALQARRPVKRQIARVLSVTWPALVLYAAIGIASPPSIAFKPVQMISSVILQKDASSSTRDIENFNLLRTLRVRPLIGVGFGHPYVEAVVAYDVTSTGFKNYRYLPHNSFLGLWAFGGLFCATGYHLLLPVAVYYAVWSRRRSKKSQRRSAGDWAACSVIAYLIQGWSDIGLQDWTNIMLCGVALGLSAALYQKVSGEIQDEISENVSDTTGSTMRVLTQTR